MYANCTNIQPKLFRAVFFGIQIWIYPPEELNLTRKDKS